MPFFSSHGRSRVLFVLGVTLVFIGVALHLPMYAMAADMHFHMAHMEMDPAMIAGMTLLVLGLAVTAVALFGRTRSAVPARLSDDALPQDLAVTGRLHREHWLLILALTIAVAIDTQKPYTFAFILPSVAAEYGLSSPAMPHPGELPVVLLPFSGITGTVLGSLLWGILGDRFGRRSALLFAAVLFVATSVCGAMPSFGWNVAMCFVMGLSAGGMLPAAFALLAETMPARHRGWVLVLVAGGGTALGFILASQVAEHMMPHYGWRILWLVGIATGALLLLAARYIPESPRYLLHAGRTEEAIAVLRLYRAPMPPARPASAGALQDVFAKPFTAVTGGLIGCAGAWGVITFGFFVWLPTNVSRAGGTTGSEITTLLAQSALLAFPVSLAVAWLYARWGARRTLITAVVLTTLVLAACVIAGERLSTNHGLLVVLLSLLLVGSWAVTAVITPYSTEIYPTSIRARGASVVAGAGKLGGVAALGMSLAGIAPPGFSGSALLALIPMALGCIVLFVSAPDTGPGDLESVAVVSAEASR
jgi:putative MFS transporter